MIDRISEAMSDDPDIEWLPSTPPLTVLWPKRPEHGLKRERSGPGSQRFRGFGTKIHAVVDGLGLPLRFILGPGLQNDMAPLVT